MSTKFRIATYNIHKCKGMDLRTNPRRIAEVLADIDADIIALQEVVSIEHASPEKNQARFIADELEYEFSLGENRLHNGGGYGNVILSRLPIIEHRNYDISVEGREARGCLHADINLGDAKPLHIYNIHLGTAFFERRKQVKRLLSDTILNRKQASARIMLGDFNEWTHGLTSRLLKAHFRSSDLREKMGRGRTYPGIFPFLHLDHIYYDEHLRLVNAFAHNSRLALLASDHVPLVADFEVEF